MYEVTKDKVEDAFIKVEQCHVTRTQTQDYDKKAQKGGTLSEQGQRWLWTSSLEKSSRADILKLHELSGRKQEHFFFYQNVNPKPKSCTFWYSHVVAWNFFLEHLAQIKINNNTCSQNQQCKYEWEQCTPMKIKNQTRTTKLAATIYKYGVSSVSCLWMHMELPAR